MSGVALARGAMAARAATFTVDEDEAGGQERAPGLELFDPCQELAADEGGMFWDFHE